MAVGKLGINKLITGTQSLGEFDIDTDSKIAFSTVNAGPTFTVEIKGKLAGQSTFTLIDTVVGSSPKTVNVLNWDFLQINITVYDSTSNYVQLLASGTNTDTAALNYINVPGGTDLVAATDLNFISSDSSITIIGDSGTNTIDLKASSSPFAKYVKTITLPDWTGPSAGEYSLTVPFSFHGIVNPDVICFEYNGTSYDQILIAVNIDASNNVTIKANQSPDTRFVGKIVIE